MPLEYWTFHNQQPYFGGPFVAGSGVALSISIRLSASLSQYAICYDSLDPNAGAVIAFGDFVGTSSGEDFMRWLAQPNGLRAHEVEDHLKNLINILEYRKEVPSLSGSILHYNPLQQQFNWVVVGRASSECICGGSGGGRQTYSLYGRVDATFGALTKSEDIMLVGQGSLDYLNDKQLRAICYLLGMDLQHALDPLQHNMAEHVMDMHIRMGGPPEGTLFALYKL